MVPKRGEVIVRVKGVMRQMSQRSGVTGGNTGWYPMGVRSSLGPRAF